jgi:hypothetical protein
LEASIIGKWFMSIEILCIVSATMTQRSSTRKIKSIPVKAEKKEDDPLEKNSSQNQSLIR